MLRLHLKRVFTGDMFRYALLAGIIFAGLSFIQMLMLFWGFDKGALPSAAIGWVNNRDDMGITIMAVYGSFLMFLISSSVYSDSLLVDVRSGTANLVVARGSLASYVFSGMLASFIGGAIAILIPLAISQLLSFAAFPIESPDGFATTWNTSVSSDSSWLEMQSNATLFAKLYFNHRYLLNAIYILYNALWAGIAATASYVVSLYYRRNKVVVLGIPTLLFLASAIVLPASMRLYGCLYPSAFGAIAPSPVFFILSPPIALAVLIGLARLALRGKKDILL